MLTGEHYAQIGITEMLAVVLAVRRFDELLVL
jgi:hypothetical protein